MERNLTTTPATGAGKLLPAEVRVLLKLKKSLALSTELAGERNGLINHFSKMFLAKRQGESEEAKTTFDLFISNIAFVRANQLHDSEAGDFSRWQSSAFHGINRELRKILGTEAMKLAEAIGKYQLPSLVRQVLVVFKTTETPENKNNLLTILRETGTKAKVANETAPLVGESLMVGELIRVIYPEDCLLITSATRIYETMVTNGFRLGLKSWHEPVFTITNLRRLFEKTLERESEFPELRIDLRRLARFLQSVGGRQQRSESGIPAIQAAAIIGEYTLAGDRQWHDDRAVELRSAENGFPADLDREAVQESQIARSLMAEVLAYEDPFEVIGTIKACLDSKFAFEFDLGYRDEMLGHSELNISESHETLAFAKKAAMTAKRAQETRGRLEGARHIRASHDVIVKLSRQVTELERFSLALEEEAGSRVVDFSGLIPMIEGQDDDPIVEGEEAL